MTDRDSLNDGDGERHGDEGVDVVDQDDDLMVMVMVMEKWMELRCLPRSTSIVELTNNN